MLPSVNELGVRMALRPKATVVMAAEGTKIPFNLNQERFFFYKHGGEVIDYEDAKGAQVKLTEICKAAVAGRDADSLVYAIFGSELDPPRWKRLASPGLSEPARPARAGGAPGSFVSGALRLPSESRNVRSSASRGKKIRSRRRVEFRQC